MRRRLVRSIVILAALATAATASAQFGHPLKGQWSGDWGVNKTDRTRVLLDIDWDGKAVTVVLNPGPNAATLAQTTVNYDTWAVRFEGDGKDRNGATVRTVIEGKLENLGAYQRFITGTWTQGSAKGDFKVTRN